MAAQIYNILVSIIWNNQLAIMANETTNLPMTDRNADDLSVSAENEEFLDAKNRLHLSHVEVQGMIDSDMFRYEKSILRWLTVEMIQNAMETLHRTSAKEETKKIRTSIYGAVENIVK